MKYHLFLDETGDHGLTTVDPNFPIFLLSGCLISKESLGKLKKQINNFKMKYFKTTEVILHSSDIRRCEKEFQILFDLKIKKEFYQDLNQIIKKNDYKIFGSAVNKEKHIQKYGKTAKNPYSLCLSFILERLVFCLDKAKNGKVKIIVEKRGRREDEQLLTQYNTILDLGTYFVDSRRLKQKIIDFEFFWKKENIVGLQLADLVAYPLARHIIFPRRPYPTYEIIKHKIYCNKDGKIDGFGLKIFP